MGSPYDTPAAAVAETLRKCGRVRALTGKYLLPYRLSARRSRRKRWNFTICLDDGARRNRRVVTRSWHTVSSSIDSAPPPPTNTWRRGGRLERRSRPGKASQNRPLRHGGEHHHRVRGFAPGPNYPRRAVIASSSSSSSSSSGDISLGVASAVNVNKQRTTCRFPAASASASTSAN